MLRHYTSHAAVKVSQAAAGSAAAHPARDRRLARSAVEVAHPERFEAACPERAEGLALSAPNG